MQIVDEKKEPTESSEPCIQEEIVDKSNEDSDYSSSDFVNSSKRAQHVADNFKAVLDNEKADNDLEE